MTLKNELSETQLALCFEVILLIRLCQLIMYNVLIVHDGEWFWLKTIDSYTVLFSVITIDHRCPTWHYCLKIKIISGKGGYLFY